MKIFYDQEVAAAYVKLFDANPTGVIVGIEILDAAKKFLVKSSFMNMKTNFIKNSIIINFNFFYIQ